MATVWAGDITPAARRTITRMPLPSLTLAKGAELGRFNMGSTVILLFEPDRVQWHSTLHAGSLVQLGQAIGMGSSGDASHAAGRDASHATGTGRAAATGRAAGTGRAIGPNP
jgi:hypothetical protein